MVALLVFLVSCEFYVVLPHDATSLMCKIGVRNRFLAVIYGVRPPNRSPVALEEISEMC